MLGWCLYTPRGTRPRRISLGFRSHLDGLSVACRCMFSDSRWTLIGCSFEFRWASASISLDSLRSSVVFLAISLDFRWMFIGIRLASVGVLVDDVWRLHRSSRILVGFSLDAR